MATVTSVTSSHDDDIDFTPPGPPMTLQEFNALSDDPTIDRMLINGRLWEKPMTKRNRWHARVEARIAQLLGNWLDTQSESIGAVFSGEVGCDFPDSDSGVGIDVAVFSADVLAAQETESKYIVGAPILAVEILSPSERQEEIEAKINVYLAAGVKLVWIIDPSFKTVTIFRPDAKPAMFSGDDKIAADPHLPGFCVPANELFE